MLHVLEPAAAILISITALLNLFVRDLRAAIAIFAIQYLGFFILVGVNLPIVLALTLLFAGWIAGVVIGMATVNQQNDDESKSSPQSAFQTIHPLFTFSISMIIYMLIFSMITQLSRLIMTLDAWQSWGALTLLGLGILRIVLTTRYASLILSLLSIFSGFEILLSGLTSSLIAAGLMAVVNLFLALIGSYLILAPSMEDVL